MIDVAEASGGGVLEVLMNAELDEALALLSTPADEPAPAPRPDREPPRPREDHSGWRLRMAERLAAELDTGRFGVAGLWVYGSVVNASAGAESDVDLLAHFRGTPEQRRELLAWLDGWSRCLAEVNFLRTGHRSEGLLDVRLLSDEDLERGSGGAARIGAATDPARPLALGRAHPTG